MPYGAVFVSTDIGGAGLIEGSRPVGRILAGYSTADPGGQVLGNSANGTAAAPLYSFLNRPNMGLYGSVVTSAAGALGVAVAGAVMGLFTSAGYSVGSSLQSTGGVLQSVYITQSSAAFFTSSGGGAAPAAQNAAAALVFDATRLKLCVYSTVVGGWVGTAAMTSS